MGADYVQAIIEQGQGIFIEVYGVSKILIVARTWPARGSSVQGYKLLEESLFMGPGGWDFLLGCNFQNLPQGFESKLIQAASLVIFFLGQAKI